MSTELDGDEVKALCGSAGFILCKVIQASLFRHWLVHIKTCSAGTENSPLLSFSTK